jgi:hypothetical protein
MSYQVDLPAGTYYVGDPVHTIPEDRFDRWFRDAQLHSEVAFSAHRAFGQDYGQDTFMEAKIDGKLAVGAETNSRKRTYVGSNGFFFYIETGLLGVVPVEVGVPSGLSQVVTFEDDFSCSNDYEIITIGDIKISTM